MRKIFVKKKNQLLTNLFKSLQNIQKGRYLQSKIKRILSLQKCQICEEEFDMENKNVRNYCHNKRNLTCRKPLLLPVIFQNLQGHGSRLFIKQLSKTKGTINSIFRIFFIYKENKSR